MRGYSEQVVFGEREVALWRRASAMVESLEQPPFTLRCHELARAVGARLGLTVQDGQYGMVDHSWLLFDPAAKRTPGRVEPERRVLRLRPLTILDVYAVGSLPMIQLISLETLLPPRSYRCGPDRDDVREDELRWVLDRLPPA